MSSIIEGYNYDIFISYRQKDNKYDGWVTEFVDNLKKELEATFKEDISVYFDINPLDGLLDTHDVDASLKEKLKCLVFIPVISRTYCDPSSFAWEHEFKAFVDRASQDQFGLKVNLPNGNVSGRVLPVRIHELEDEDKSQCEAILGSVLRGVEFIYKEPGVNRPLLPKDHEEKNILGINYRNQVNKAANAVQEILSGMRKAPGEYSPAGTASPTNDDQPQVSANSIIVLPFDNISPDPGQDYFSDGLTEEIITELSHIHDLLVISRSSAISFKGTQKTIPEIAQAVKVKYVLEGSVRKAGNNLRITAQLIDAQSDTHLWAEKYTGTLDDIFEIQESVSRKIVEGIKGKLTKKDKEQLSYPSYTQNIGVYEAYARAHYEFWKYDAGSLEHALSILEEAVSALGEHPLLLSGIGAIHWQYYHLWGDINETHLIRIRECADKLFAMDPSSAYGHRLVSNLALNSGDTDVAIIHLKQANESDPGDTETLLWLSYLLAFHAGKYEEAQPVVDRLNAIDPLNPMAAYWLIEWMKGDLEPALADLRECHRKFPLESFPPFYLGHLLAWLGNKEESLRLAEEMYFADTNVGMAQTLRFVALAINGKKEDALNAVSASTKEWAWRDFHLPWLMAEGYAVLGDLDEAMKWLEQAVERGIFNYPLFNNLDPLFKNLRGDTRFEQLMQKIKHKWENFKV